jgi:hypothetical protein
MPRYRVQFGTRKHSKDIVEVNALSKNSAIAIASKFATPGARRRKTIKVKNIGKEN